VGVPQKADGSFDHDAALTGDDLVDFVNRKLFPYLQGFKQRAAGAATIEYKIGEIFSEIKNKFSSGYSLRDALELLDGLRFRSQAEKHELSSLYETRIKNMGNAGRNGGEYYTPRPLMPDAAKNRDAAMTTALPLRQRGSMCVVPARLSCVGTDQELQGNARCGGRSGSC